MSNKQKIIYYKDELNDDFANTNIERKELGSKFKYIHNNIFFKIFEFIIYYFIAWPLVFVIQKVYSHQKFINKKALKKVKEGYFLYSNHTQCLNDSFIGPLFTWPKKCFIITNPDATSIKGLRIIVQALGAIPLGSTLSENKKMINCIKKRIDENNVIMIYPEAHIWPYYTKIRPFNYQSFKYPVKYNKPIFVLTNCYQKRKFFKRPKIKTFIDGPFYPNVNLNDVEAANELRNITYNIMCNRTSQHSNYEYIKYVKIE